MSRAEELKQVNNIDAIEGQAWKCPDCDHWATLGCNAFYHAKHLHHGVPTLVPYNVGIPFSITGTCSVELKADHVISFVMQTNDPIGLFHILRAVSLQITSQRVQELRGHIGKNITAEDDKLLSEVEKIRNLFLAHYSPEKPHGPLPNLPSS